VDLDGVAYQVLVTNPGYVRMRRHPEFRRWAADLIRLGEAGDLRPLGDVLRLVAGDALESFEPIRDLLQRRARDMDAEVFVRASEVSEQAAGETPHAAFILAWLSLLGWMLGTGERLYDMDYGGGPGTPHPGWLSVPYACASAALKLSGFHGTLPLVERAQEVLQVASRRAHRSGPYQRSIDAATARYRQLGRRIAARYEMAVGDLADELGERCRPGPESLRAEVGAIMWSLGLVPECHAVLAGSTAPTRRLMRRLVRESLRCLPDDPLVQYVWLELKDRPGFDLRAHEALFTVINHLWGQWLVDGSYPTFGLDAPPSRVYAQTLIRLLAGSITEPQAQHYLAVYDRLMEWSVPVSWLVPHRLHMLRHRLGERFDYYLPEVTAGGLIGPVEDLVEAAGRRTEEFELHPERPAAAGRLSLAVFELVERCLSDGVEPAQSDPARRARTIDGIERFRAGALSYWLRVSPPLVPIGGHARSASLLRAEKDLIGHLRNAYFVALSPTLPLYYSWYDLEYGDFTALQAPGARERFWSPDAARGEIEGIEAEMAAIAERLRAASPGYAERRLQPAAHLGRLVESLSQHTRPAGRARRSRSRGRAGRSPREDAGRR
jgi:hypothetical protein